MLLTDPDSGAFSSEECSASKRPNPNRNPGPSSDRIQNIHEYGILKADRVSHSESLSEQDTHITVNNRRHGRKSLLRPMTSQSRDSKAITAGYDCTSDRSMVESVMHSNAQTCARKPHGTRTGKERIFATPAVSKMQAHISLHILYVSEI